jgi:hypothetical protein
MPAPIQTSRDRTLATDPIGELLELIIGEHEPWGSVRQVLDFSRLADNIEKQLVWMTPPKVI